MDTIVMPLRTQRSELDARLGLLLSRQKFQNVPLPFDFRFKCDKGGS